MGYTALQAGGHNGRLGRIAEEVVFLLSEICYYARVAAGVRELVRMQPPPDPLGTVRRQMEDRTRHFLDMARDIVFANPKHPYRRMFQLAGCEYPDLEESVRRQGLEKTLEALRRNGVWLSHAEFKDSTPIVRSGEVIESNLRSFRNPFSRGGIESMTGGSRSKGTPTRSSIDTRRYREGYRVLEEREFGTRDRALIVLRPILPSAVGLQTVLHHSRRIGHPVHWFAIGGTLRNSGHYRAVTRTMVHLGNLLGARAPQAVYLPENDFLPVAETIANLKAAGTQSLVFSFVSPAVRVSLAAREKGLDIAGALFIVGGEALTSEKRAAIEASGALVYPRYWINEIGPIGLACRRMTDGNRVHLFEDSVEVISQRQTVPHSDVDVNALLFTTLLPTTERFLINVCMDDSGSIEPANCSCGFQEIGFTRQVRDISSFGKLTGLGMTLVGTDVVRVLEEALPRRLGGGPGDYQLVEREDQGQTILELRASPRIVHCTEDLIRECFLEELKGVYGGSLAAREWRHAGAVRVVIAEPVVTQPGKILALHLLGEAASKYHVA